MKKTDGIVIIAPTNADDTEKTIQWIGVVDRVTGNNVHFTLATKHLDNKWEGGICVPKKGKVKVVNIAASFIWDGVSDISESLEKKFLKLCL